MLQQRFEKIHVFFNAFFHCENLSLFESIASAMNPRRSSTLFVVWKQTANFPTLRDVTSGEHLNSTCHNVEILCLTAPSKHAEYFLTPSQYSY